MKKVDSMLLETNTLKEINETTKIVNFVYSGIWPVWGRDLVSCEIDRLEEGGKKRYIGFRVSKMPYPERSDFVRGVCNVGGYILERVDDRNTRVTYLSDLDIRGTAPDFIKQKACRDQG